MFRAFGLPELVILGGAFVLIGLLLFVVGEFFGRWRSRRIGPTLIPIEFRLNGLGDASELIYFRGRPGGLWGRVLSALSLHYETVLSVTDEEFKISCGGISGFHIQSAPLAYIASSDCTLYRKILFLALAFGLCFFGVFLFIYSTGMSDDYARQKHLGDLAPALVLCALGAIGLFVLYKFSRRVVISVETFGGTSLAFRYKRGFVSGQPVELPQAVEAVRLLNNAVRQRAFERSVKRATAAD